MGKGGLKVQKPSRSDEVLDAQQQWQIAEQIKSHFESVAPKRRRKPNRSEGSDDHQDIEGVEDDRCDDIPPEFQKYQQLKSHSGSLIVSEKVESLPEEFVETDYYEDLNAVERLHHPTGDAFIKLEYDGGSYFRLGYQEETGLMERIPVRSNPATNDWFPAPGDDQETTGDAFIKLEYDGGSYFRLGYQEETGLMERIPVRSNPATNDWIPAPGDDQETVMAVSSKPIRSG